MFDEIIKNLETNDKSFLEADLSNIKLTKMKKWSLAAALKKNKTILSLILKNNDLNTVDLERILNPLVGHPKLVKLDLSDNPIGGEKLPQILKNFLSAHPNITELDLHRTKIDDKTVQVLAECLVSNCCLTTLNIEDNCITDKSGILIIAALYLNTKLNVLKFHNNNLSTEMAIIIDRLMHLKPDMDKEYLDPQAAIARMMKELTEKLLASIALSEKIWVATKDNNSYRTPEQQIKINELHEERLLCKKEIVKIKNIVFLTKEKSIALLDEKRFESLDIELRKLAPKEMVTFEDKPSLDDSIKQVDFLQVSEDGKLLISAGNGIFNFIDLQSYKIKQTETISGDNPAAIGSLKLLTNGQLIYVRGDYSITIWQQDITGVWKYIQIKNNHGIPVCELDNNEILCTGVSIDNPWSIWKMDSIPWIQTQKVDVHVPQFTLEALLLPNKKILLGDWRSNISFLNKNLSNHDWQCEKTFYGKPLCNGYKWNPYAIVGTSRLRLLNDTQMLICNIKYEEPKKTDVTDVYDYSYRLQLMIWDFEKHQLMLPEIFDLPLGKLNISSWGKFPIASLPRNKIAFGTALDGILVGTISNYYFIFLDCINQLKQFQSQSLRLSASPTLSVDTTNLSHFSFYKPASMEGNLLNYSYYSHLADKLVLEYERIDLRLQQAVTNDSIRGTAFVVYNLHEISSFFGGWTAAVQDAYIAQMKLKYGEASIVRIVKESTEYCIVVFNVVDNSSIGVIYITETESRDQLSILSDCFFNILEQIELSNQANTSKQINKVVFPIIFNDCMFIEKSPMKYPSYIECPSGVVSGVELIIPAQLNGIDRFYKSYPNSPIKAVMNIPDDEREPYQYLLGTYIIKQNNPSLLTKSGLSFFHPPPDKAFAKEKTESKYSFHS